MDYEKKYKDALERAKEVYHRGYYISGDLEYIFPKLKENEDDRIRKSLIDMLKNDEKCYLKEIAWLEKQGDTWKPSDEQMNLLEVLVEDNSQMYFFTTLESLYKQLKKLKGD